jgi:glycosyltransferase involved in cell wall biosynthesis
VAVRQRLGFAPHSFVIGFIGRLELAKNPSCLIEICQGLQSVRRVGEIRFLVVGSGPLREPFQEQVRLAGLEHAFLLIPPTDHIRLVYAALDVLLLPSLIEGCPNVVLEAMSQALPVVAAAVGGVPEMIEHGVDGLTYPSTDLHAATHHLDTLARRTDFRDALGRCARTTVETRFDLACRQKTLAAIYRAVSGK